MHSTNRLILSVSIALIVGLSIGLLAGGALQPAANRDLQAENAILRAQVDALQKRTAVQQEQLDKINAVLEGPVVPRPTTLPTEADPFRTP